MFLATLSSIFRSRAALQLENLALRHQIGVLQRSTRRCPRLTAVDRLVWVWLSRVWSGWRSTLAIVQPEAVLAWHRAGFRLFWTATYQLLVRSGSCRRASSAPIFKEGPPTCGSATTLPMCSGWIDLGSGEDTTQRRFVEHEHMVQALAPDRTMFSRHAKQSRTCEPNVALSAATFLHLLCWDQVFGRHSYRVMA
jgi:hypothetical protein